MKPDAVAGPDPHAYPRRMQNAADIVSLIAGCRRLMGLLGAVESLDLPDGWIGAGAIRNRVWDHLHGRTKAGETDVDVVYFDPSDLSQCRERELEFCLRDMMPDADWQVRNQARMHLGNGDRAYRDTADALCHWPETATAVAARLRHGRVDLLAPLGLDDLLGLVVRPTPAFRNKADIFAARQKAKNWRARWPRLTFAA